jgi:aspartate 1-decarboxylase
MLVHFFRAKLHRVTVTEANLNYMGSITIDENLLDASGIFANEKVQVVNINNGERFETYVIKGERGSGVICLNGPAARRVQQGDKAIVIAYGMLPLEEAKAHVPTVVYVDENNIQVKN